MTKRVEIALLTLICSLFFVLASYNIELPGLYYDEALDVVPTMQLATGQPIDKHNSVEILGRRLPIMVSEYVGAVSTYLTLPFFLLLGVSVSSLRLTTIVFAVGTIIFTFCFLKLFFDRKVALLAALLLAVNPAFIMWSRQGNHVSSLMSFMSTGSLYCFYLWYEKRKNICLYLGSFLLGLGLYQKIIFLWFIIALGLAVLTQRANVLGVGSWKLDGFGLKPLGLSLLSFCAALSLMLWYNLTTLGTIKTILGNLVVTSGGVNNLDFLTNFLKRVQDFGHVLSGDFFTYTGGSYANRLYIPLFVVAFLFCLVISFLPTKSADRGKTRFIMSLFIALFIFSCFTIGGLSPYHLLIFLPLPQVIISLFICDAGGLLSRAFNPPDWVGRTLTMVPFIAAAAIVVLDLGVIKSYHVALGETGGVGMFSDAIYDLADYLEDNGITTPLAVDWGFKKNIQLLTKGAVNPIEIFQYSWNPNEEFSREVSKRLIDPNNLYLFHAEEFTSFKRYDAFERIVREADKVIQLERTFYQRDGRLVYYLYRVTTLGQGYSLWKEGEDYEANFGSKSEDFKGGASNGKCLGMGWGSEASHFAVYRVFVAEDIPKAYIRLRYAHPDNRAKKLNLYLDGKLVGTKPSIVLPGSGGWGYEGSEWATMSLFIGRLDSGEHWIEIQPDGDNNTVNIDGFYIETIHPSVGNQP